MVCVCATPLLTFGHTSIKTSEFQGQIDIEIPKNTFLFGATKWLKYHLDLNEEITVDKALGTLTGKCKRDVKMKFSGIEVPMTLHYTIELKYLGDKVTYQIYHISYKSIPDKGYKSHTVYVDKWFESQSKSATLTVASNYMNNAVIEVGEIIGHLSYYLQNEAILVSNH